MSDKKIDWYKLLGIKRKKEDIKLNDENKENKENTENRSIIKEPKKDEKNSFENSFKKLRSLSGKLKVIVPNLIDKKSFSLKKILSEKLNIQSINNEKKELTKTTNECTIKDGNNTKNKNIIYSEDADDSDSLYISDKSEIKEAPLPEMSINQNCK